jgi:type I restriction enzyme S subunit
MMVLNDICNVITCGVAKRPEYIEKGVPFLSSKNVKSDRFILNAYNHVSKEDYLSLTKNNKPEVDDILYTRVGSFGEAAVIDLDFDFAIFVSLTLLKPKKDIVLPRYLMHYLNSPRIKHLAKNSTSGVGVQNLNVKVVRQFPINLPPIEQQKKIAAILDAADTYRQKTKALITKYDELTQSLFLDMFGDPVRNPKGWEEIKLGNICGVGSSKRVFVDELVEDGIPFYRGTEVGKLGEGKSIIPKLFITKEHYERLKEHRGIPKKGDLLMPSICPDGRIWVVDDDKEFYFKDGRVLWVEVDSRKINSIYLRYHMKGSFFANYNNIASGTTFAELKIVALKKMNIFYPDIALQNQFADSVKAIETQKTQAQASLVQAEDLFNSLLQRAFKGELVS